MLSIEDIRRSILSRRGAAVPKTLTPVDGGQATVASGRGTEVRSQRSEVSLAEQLACARRELALRRNAYPRQIAARRLTPATAERETAAMAAIVETLERCLLLEEVSAEMRAAQ